MHHCALLCLAFLMKYLEEFINNMKTKMPHTNKFRILDSYRDAEEIIFNNGDELREVLNNFLQYGARVVILESSNVGSLTIGIGRPYGFVQFIGNDNLPPYLVATQNNVDESSSYVEFDAGGTKTQILKSNCLEFDTVIEIAVFFYKNGRLPEYINWQEV